MKFKHLHDSEFRYHIKEQDVHIFFSFDSNDKMHFTGSIHMFQLVLYALVSTISIAVYSCNYFHFYKLHSLTAH